MAAIERNAVSKHEENLSKELRESVERGLADSAAGRVVDLGSFARYAEDGAEASE